MNAVKLHSMEPSSQMSAKQRYGGLRRGALLYVRAREFAPAVHAPAHRKLEDIEQLPPPERWIGQASWRADREATGAFGLRRQALAAK
eukprot:5068926-Pyramimonas_sp.AAC.1